MLKRIITISLTLLLASLAQAKEYKGGEIQSKQSFHYGRFETRIYASDVSGVLSTFFLFENEGWKNDHIWQEIDVEIFGKDPENKWQTNVIYEKDAAGSTIHSEEIHTLSKDQKVSAWHVYTVDWTPDYIEWFVDGVSIRKFTDKEVLDVIGAKPMLLMFNCWSHESVEWVGELSPAQTPTYQYVDYVKVYDWQSANKFSSKASFTENFDTDLDKWNISTHSFDGNVCDFATTNAKAINGSLVLAFSTEAKASSVMDKVVIPK